MGVLHRHTGVFVCPSPFIHPFLNQHDPADRGGHPSDCILTDAFLCGPSELWSIGCALTRHG